MRYKLIFYIICFLVLINIASASKPYFSNITQTFFEMDEYSSFNYQLNVIDQDNDILNYTYITNWQNFNIDKNGLINFQLYGGNEGLYNVLVIVYDPFLNADVITLTFNITNVNERPIINSFSPDTNTQVDEGSTLIFKINITDPEHDALSYKWYHDLQLKSESETFECPFDYNSEGINNITVLVTDSKETISKSWVITVNNVDRKPYLKENIPDQKWTENTDYTIDLSNYFGDDDNDPLTFSSTAAENIDTSIDNDIVTLISKKDWYGASEIIFYAQDGKGNKIESNKINLIVKEGPRCGNDKCEETENCENCKSDCKCSFGFICKNSQCIEKELIEKQKPKSIEKEEQKETNPNDKVTGFAIINIIKSKPIMALIILIVVILSCFSAYWFIFRKKKETYGF